MSEIRSALDSPFACVSTDRIGGTGVKRRISILGSTGSIGTSTLDVVRALPEHLEVVGLAAHTQWNRLKEQAWEFRPRFAVLTDEETAKRVGQVELPPETEFLIGERGIQTIVQQSDVDMVVTAIVGAAGLLGTYEAILAGKAIALANKETMVVAGALIQELAKERKVPLLPVDSEHSAIFQALQGNQRSSVEKVILTGSGGPFRGYDRERLRSVSVEQALRHPTWQMGNKITIDSATLMNKALELIEAHWLFDLPANKLDVIIHRESMIHSFVEYEDGSVLAQLSPPDMRLPIQYALLYPERHRGPAKRMNWRDLNQLNFEAVNREVFPALDLGYEVIQNGGTAGAVLNAANEIAVQRFLNREISFLEITEICQSVLSNHQHSAKPTLAELLAADHQTRLEVYRWKRR